MGVTVSNIDRFKDTSTLNNLFIALFLRPSLDMTVQFLIGLPSCPISLSFLSHYARTLLICRGNLWADSSESLFSTFYILLSGGL
jgi:hypothetical protein